MKVNFNNIKIIKKLGTGFSGTTYLVLYKKKKYALKIQHIFDTNIKNKKSDLWNEINFIKYVNKYPITFRHTYDYNIIHNCNFVKNNKSIGLNVYNNGGEYKRLQQSKLCIQYITDYQKNVLSNIIDKLNIKQIYSLILQLLYGIYILQQKKYTHNDFNLFNITYNVSNKKYKLIYIQNRKYKIPLYKYIYTIIDYGNVNHPKFIKNNKEKIKYLQNYKNIDINNLIDNIKNYWNIKFNIFKEDVQYMIDNNNSVIKIIHYFLNKLHI